MTAAGALPETARLLAAMDATWPAASETRIGPWRLREGRGGGSRVSSISWEEPGRHPDAADIAPVEAAARALGQRPVFRLSPAETEADALLAARGYRILDPVVLLAAPLAEAWPDPAPVTAFALAEPLQILCDIWAETGIGPARQAIMARAAGPKASLLGRSRDRCAGAAFVALHDGIAMLHALSVLPALRRLGTARNIMLEAGRWSREAGAGHLALAVTEANAGALALYAGMGFRPAGHYRYREAPE